jgi:polyhydroxyalkanoate synthase
MDKDLRAEDPILDTREMNRALARIAESSRRTVAEFLDRQARDASLVDLFDPLHIGDAFLQMTAQILASPAQIVEAQISLWSNYLQLWQTTARTMMGDNTAAPPAAAEQWNQTELFDFIKQSYLLTARWIQALLRGDGTQGKSDAHMVDFYTRQFIDAMTPAGFFAANADVLAAVSASHGETLVRGLDQVLAELERGKNRLTGRTRASRLGSDIAATPGKVVFRNETMELLQYAPSTVTVHEVPLLIVPPWNARHYLLDLAPSQSLVKWAVDHGHTVFAMSWAPPEGELAKRDFAETLTHGPLAALDAIEKATGQKRVNGLGFGLGGTLLAATLGTLATRGEDRFASATYLGTLVDFFEVGEISVFTNEETVRMLDLKRNDDNASRPQGGTRGLAATLDLLRANDLIWSFIIDCYLDANTPLPFETLRWNADSLNSATAMQEFFLHSIYQRNLLAEPGGIILQGTPIDLGGITAPSYVLAGREDHISPWKTAFAAVRLFSGPVRFVLAPSGHTGAIVCPPGRARGYWTNTRRTKDPQTWLDHATREDGSWWEDWSLWLAPLSGPMVPARPVGRGKAKALGDAPGRYILGGT